MRTEAQRVEACRKALDKLLAKFEPKQADALRTIGEKLSREAWEALNGLLGSQQLAGQIIVYGFEPYVGFWGGSDLCRKFETILVALRKYDMYSQDNFVLYMTHSFVETFSRVRSKQK